MKKKKIVILLLVLSMFLILIGKLINVQCLRKTYQGYYAVLLQDDGKYAFVFMNKNGKLYEMLLIDEIKGKKEYSFIEQGKTTENEILSFDKNAILLPVSSSVSTVHIVHEGLLVITYTRFNEKTQRILDDPLVKSVVFYEDEDFPLKDNEMINKNVPYILAIDKT